MVEHDSGEERENDTRRDDVLENDVLAVGREFQRGSDAYAEDRSLRHRMAEQTVANNQRLFEQTFQQSDKLNDLETRRRERAEVQTDDRSGLQFRDAALHSTAVGALEGEVVAVGEALEEAVEDDEAE